MLSRGLLLGVIGAWCLSLFALLWLPMGHVDTFGAYADLYFYGRGLLCIGGCGLVFACVAACVPALEGVKAESFGQAAAALLGMAVMVGGLASAHPDFLPIFALPAGALGLAGGSVFAFGLSRLPFAREVVSPRPACLLLAFSSALALLAAAVFVLPVDFAPRFGEPILFLVGQLVALPAAVLFAYYAFVLWSFHRAAEAASLAGGDGRPDNVPDIDRRPWHQHKASDARPDHLRRGDDPPRPA